MRILSKQRSPFSTDQVRAAEQYIKEEGYVSTVDKNYLRQQLTRIEHRILSPEHQQPQSQQATKPMNFEHEMNVVRQTLADEAWSKLEDELAKVLLVEGRPLNQDQMHAIKEWIAKQGSGRHLTSEALDQRIHALVLSLTLRGTPFLMLRVVRTSNDNGPPPCGGPFPSRSSSAGRYTVPAPGGAPSVDGPCASRTHGGYRVRRLPGPQCGRRGLSRCPD